MFIITICVLTPWFLTNYIFYYSFANLVHSQTDYSLLLITNFSVTTSKTVKEFYIILLTILIAGQSLAHGDLHEMIKKVSKEIKSSPDSAFLYLKRGELYFQHEDFEESIEDYTTCSKLGYNNPRLYFAFAKTYDRIENYNFALSYINKILIDNALNVKALRLKGQILCRTKQYLSGADRHIDCFQLYSISNLTKLIQLKRYL
jgi:tetratricopeptide (TPR) repeat protein